MRLTRRAVLGTTLAASVAPLRRPRAQAPGIRIGVMNDMSGPYRDDGGMTG